MKKFPGDTGLVSLARLGRVRSVLCLALLVLMLAGCDPRSPRADLVFLNGAEPETLDPALITGQPEGRIASALFEGLTAFNAAGRPEPGVAERWEITPDGRVYTFHLRPDARWSDGRTVTAQDFVRSWERTLNPATASEYAYQLHYIQGGRAYNEGATSDFSSVGVKAHSDLVLQVTLENPTPFFLDLCSFVTLLPVPVDVVNRHGDSWVKPEHIVSNGAYTLESWRINDRIALRKNPHYWNREQVSMQTVDVIPVSKANTAFNFYASGQADLMMDKGLVPPALLGELRKRSDFHAAPFLGNYFIRFNTTRQPFDDPRVRLAFSLVVDKEVIVQKITRAGEVAAHSLVPPGTAGYEPPAGLVRDVTRARQLLAEAGYPDGAGFPRVAYLYSEGELNEAIAVELQNMFATALGVHVELARQEWKVYLNSMSNLDYDLCRSSWVGDYADPNTFLDMFVTGGGNNRTGWSHPEYDRLIAAAAREVDTERRWSIFRRAETLLIAEEAPICPLYYYVGIQFYDPARLGGIEANVLDEHPLRKMYWKTP